MPDRDVKTIRDQIYFQYAKLIARAAFKCKDGKEAKAKCYGFIKSTFKDLQSGEKSWSDITREDKEFAQSEKECIYCGAKKNLSWEHIVPKSLTINGKCPACPAIQGISNQVWACKSCNSSKNDLGLYAYFKRENPKEKKYFDILPALLEKKYLKTIYKCHECAGDLDKAVEGVSVLNLDFG
jgi:5-methylcytosine-specific restriction endonuclease McrA